MVIMDDPKRESLEAVLAREYSKTLADSLAPTPEITDYMTPYPNTASPPQNSIAFNLKHNFHTTN